MILGTFNAVLVVKMTPEDGEIDLRVIYMGEFSSDGNYVHAINRPNT